jgi:glycosyltransferase involved in cell wall biosynthesis
MRIAQVAPLAEAVPPKLYGGTERVVSWLTEELVAQGSDVTLFASGDSQTSAKLVPCAPEGLRLRGIGDFTASHLVMLDQVRRRADEFDIIHMHVDVLPFPLFGDLSHKSLVTLHGRLDLPDFRPIYEAFPSIPLVSISNAQRAPMPPHINWLATVHHGLDPDAYHFHEKGGDYLAFLGRISPEKRPDRAIEIAKKAGMRLRIAAKVDPMDEEYFRTKIVPLLEDSAIEFVGEVGDEEKLDFLGNARALLFPIDWPEPFGLVMIEAMAVGTPVIAWRNGSVPEVVSDGVSGAIVETVDDAVKAVSTISTCDRRTVRQYFETRFTARRMATDYLAAYKKLLSVQRPTGPRLIATR